ncbi:MAG: DUF2283 domain-containing protein [Vulcanimicrobiaceae bacterium]
MTSEGPRGPVYIRFSDDPVYRTEPAERDAELIVDYDVAGAVTGIELVSISLGAFTSLLDVARSNDLDLAALLARSFTASTAA